MNTQNTISIDAWFPSNRPPHIHEHANRIVAVNSTSTASLERCLDILCRIQIYCASALQDCPDGIVYARDLFLPDEYAALIHREKCLNGMIVARHCREGLIPLEKLPYASSPARYRIVPERIDFDLVYSLLHGEAA